MQWTAVGDLFTKVFVEQPLAKPVGLLIMTVFVEQPLAKPVGLFTSRIKGDLCMVQIFEKTECAFFHFTKKYILIYYTQLFLINL